MDKKKRIKKIKSLEKQKDKHRDKIKEYSGKNYALLDYWEKEIEQFEVELEKEREKIEKK